VGSCGAARFPPSGQPIALAGHVCGCSTFHAADRSLCLLDLSRSREPQPASRRSEAAALPLLTARRRPPGRHHADSGPRASSRLAWPLLPLELQNYAERTIAAWERMPGDPHGTTYGFFDGHGWNMAFDHAAGRLNGDSGFGPLHYEFIHTNWISPDLTERVVAEYKTLTGRELDRERIKLITGVLPLQMPDWSRARLARASGQRTMRVRSGRDITADFRQFARTPSHGEHSPHTPRRAGPGVRGVSIWCRCGTGLDTRTILPWSIAFLGSPPCLTRWSRW
jgi:hypothetical protein